MKFIRSPYFKIAALIFTIALLWYESFIQHNKDLDVFIGASDLISQHKNCYNVYIQTDAYYLRYFYSPLFAILLYPLKDLPQVVYNLIWLSFNFLVLFRSFVLLTYFLKLTALKIRLKHLFYILLIASMARYIVDNLALGQMTFILVWGSLESMRLIFEKKLIWGSALLALIINFKIIPIALFAYLAYKREFRAVLVTTFFSVVFLFLPAIIIGYNFNNELLGNWYLTLTEVHNDSINEDLGLPSLSSLVPALLMDMKLLFPIKRNFVNLDASDVTIILNIVRVVFLILAAVLFGQPFHKNLSKQKLFYDLSILCILTPLIFPHQGKYSVYYLFPAYAYCIYFLVRFRAIRTQIVAKKIYKPIMIFTFISFVLVTLTTDGLIGRYFSDFAEYLYLITFGIFSLLIAMVYLKPKRTNGLTLRTE